IKKSELGACTAAGIGVNILNSAAAPGTLAHGTAVLSSDGNKNIIYTPAAGFVGQDSVRYTIICGVNTSTGLVLINVTDKPDVIKDEACAVTPPPMQWTIKYDYYFNSACYLSTYHSAVCGDLDNDGIVEIVLSAKPFADNATNTSTYGIVRPAQSIAIFKGNDISAPWRVFNTEKAYSWSANQKFGLVKTKINSQDTTLIIVMERDGYLRAYNYLGQRVWQSNAIYDALYNSTSYTDNYLVSTFADFNKDGIPEILVGRSLFDSATGNLLCSTTGTSPADPSIAADLFNTGTLNFIMGNKIYDVHIQSLDPSDATNFALNSLTLHTTITPPTITNADPDYTSASPLVVPAGGRVSAVDIDHDGKLDLVISRVSGSYTVIYVADPVSGTVKASKYIPKAGVSGYPFIGDIDGDGNVEIVVIKALSAVGGDNPDNDIIALKYNGTSLLQVFWTMHHTDGSGLTGMTLFDFDQDGQAEIVYRDEQFLRIMDGSADGAINYPNRNKAVFPNTSGTGSEYPIVADVDGDGQAEIIIVGGSSLIPGTNASTQGALWVFKSGSADAPWAPARQVWNTQNYNSVYVNGDLSIPSNPLNPASLFVDKDGKYLQPFNSFMQQSTLLNGEGKMLS
ncbi:MAG: FG-GAP-like repeat-containing protein, partial [Dysgonamonadaceae bacterium]|nr:FG-GAP-like repeat-containing protein [Dysgonamonadaceae bacterium]